MADLTLFTNQNSGRNEQTMTSREIAKYTGKDHSHVMRDIREMEPAWEKVHQSKFGLTFSISKLPNGGQRKDPYYELTKAECLYIATKFNDEARARLVIRWVELETQERENKEREQNDFTNPDTVLRIVQNWKEDRDKRLKAEQEAERLRLANEIQVKELHEAAPKVEYYDNVLKSKNLMPVTLIASDLGISAIKLNAFLKDAKI